MAWRRSTGTGRCTFWNFGSGSRGSPCPRHEFRGCEELDPPGRRWPGGSVLCRFRSTGTTARVAAMAGAAPELLPSYSPESLTICRSATTILVELMRLSDEEFAARFSGSPVKRAKRCGLLRNVAVALGNWGSREAVPALAAALEDEEPLIRGHAAWSLGFGGRLLTRAHHQGGVLFQNPAHR
jgi:hypothetical protein